MVVVGWLIARTVRRTDGRDFAQDGHLGVRADRQNRLLPAVGEQPGLRGVRRGGRSRWQRQLAQDVRDVAVHGVLAEHESLGRSAGW
jgi:hypothetical protein